MVNSIKNQYTRWAVAGVALGVLIFVFPPLYGEGYEAFTSLMRGDKYTIFENSLFYNFREIEWVVLIYIVAIIFFKC
jgi:CIC family chloride channel protein